MALTIDQKRMIAAAQKAGRWLIRNQVKDELDANCGRFLYCYNIESGYYERSTGWQTGMGIIALLWLRATDPETDYRDTLQRAASYLLSLQALDPENSRQFGAFHEETPQTPWMHPRDAVSAGWGLLALYHATGAKACFTAAQRFADWHLANAWANGWPVATVQLGPGGREDSDIQFNCQAGAAAFFLDLYHTTNDRRYLEQGTLALLDYYLEHFLETNGQPHIIYDHVNHNWDRDKPIPPDPQKGQREGNPPGWMEMHRFNDDFAALALLKAYRQTRQEKYLQAVKTYASWVISRQNADGSFGNLRIEVANSCVPIFLLDLAAVTGSKEYDGPIEKSLRRLLTLQRESDSELADGAFLCLNNLCQHEPGKWVNIRNTAYSMVALLKAAGVKGPALAID